MRLSSIRPRLTYANVMSTLALFIALGGTSYAVARNSVGTRQLKNKAVTSAKVRNGAITSAKVRNGTLTTKDFAAAALRGTARGPRGAIGPPGPFGPPGPQGPPGPGAAEPWRPLAFANGWGDYGGIWEAGAYRKDQFGIVHLRGLVTRVTGPPDGLIAILGEGYRPRLARLFVVHTGEGHGVGRVDVLPSGEIRWSSATFTGEKDYTSLEGISFDTG